MKYQSLKRIRSNASAFAAEVKKIAKVRLEYCPEFDKSMHIDILVIINNKWIPVELKYKTRECFKQIVGASLILLWEIGK